MNDNNKNRSPYSGTAIVFFALQAPVFGQEAAEDAEAINDAEGQIEEVVVT